ELDQSSRPAPTLGSRFSPASTGWLRLTTSLLRRQGGLLPTGGLPAPGVDVGGVQPLTPQEGPSLPLRGRFVLPEHLELVLGRESSSLGLGQYLGVSLRGPVLLGFYVCL